MKPRALRSVVPAMSCMCGTLTGCQNSWYIDGEHNRYAWSQSAGTFSWDLNRHMSLQCRMSARTLRRARSRATLFPGPGMAGVAKDWHMSKDQQNDEIYFVLQK